MIQEITVEGLVQLSNPIFIDVRSESEFAEATIPGAISVPIFSDVERAELGTVFKNISPLVAKDLGLSLAAPKLPEIVKHCRELSEQGPLVFFCWRGGMRSKAVASILDLMGIRVYRLIGGYKAYRRSIVDFWDQVPFPYGVVVLRGNTGVGKTKLIEKLQLRGRPAIDLERLANNRGSVFGSVGLGAAPSQKSFEANLTEQIKAYGSINWIVVECESKRIGRVTLPNSLHQAMENGKQVLTYDSIENRVCRLVEEYTTSFNSGPELEAALNRLVKRLGHQRVTHLQDLLEGEDYAAFARILLEEYYDPLYGYPNEPRQEYHLNVDMGDEAGALQQVEDYLDSLEAEHTGETTLSRV
jgi:tRNA 2-selenouridine synthase